jgi:hypothetical protein
MRAIMLSYGSDHIKDSCLREDPSCPPVTPRWELLKPLPPQSLPSSFPGWSSPRSRGQHVIRRREEVPRWPSGCQQRRRVARGPCRYRSYYQPTQVGPPVEESPRCDDQVNTSPTILIHYLLTLVKYWRCHWHRSFPRDSNSSGKWRTCRSAFGLQLYGFHLLRSHGTYKPNTRSESIYSNSCFTDIIGRDDRIPPHSWWSY